MGRPPRITREQILDAARRTFTERGFAASTLADIAKPIGVTPAAILRHFATKQELFAAAMSGEDAPLPPPIEELARVDANEDPRAVLRRFAEQFVPLVSAVIRPAIAVQMHKAAQQTTVVVPFDTAHEETPPKRGLRIVAEYFRRAMTAGVIREGDPRALAVLFAGQLQGYVFIHYVLNVTPVLPLENYVDALLDLWSRGAMTGGIDGRKARPAQTSDSDSHPPRGRGRNLRVSPGTEKAKADRAGRNSRSEDGERRVSRGRPRSPRSRR
jgi:AcrR family transcriptional regulator